LTSKGLLLSDSPGLLDFQEPYARPRDEVASWAGDSGAGRIGLAEVVAHAHPTMLIGTSTHSGAFTEAIVKDRMTVYHKQTSPLIAYYSKQGKLQDFQVKKGVADMPRLQDEMGIKKA
jgi:malic enzyme